MKVSYLFLIFLLATSLQAQWSNDPNNNLVIGYGLNHELCSDCAGGCYITYEAGYPAELYLHRVDRYGYQPWGDKRIIAGELDEQKSAKIIEDGEGGVIVSYGDHILHDTYRLRVQKVDRNGNFLWGQTGIRVSVVDTGQSVQRIVSDGDGGCVIVWMESIIGSAEYRMNRIDRNGQRVWSDSGIYIQSDYNYSKPRLIRAGDGKYYLEIRENIFRISQNGEFTLWESTIEWGLIVATPDGGGIIHSSIWNPSYYNLLAQRKDTLGNNLWQEPYVEIADSLDINTILRIHYNNGYYYYGWDGKKNGVDNIAQFQALRMDGSRLFSNGSITVTDIPVGTPSLYPSNESKIIIIWNDDLNLADTTLAQIYDTLGNKNWDENGIVVAHPSISYQRFTNDGNGGFIIGGLINDFTVVLQQVSRYGKLGEIITSVKSDYNTILEHETTLYQNFTNPFNSSTVIKYSLSGPENISIKIYDVSGQLVKEINNEHNQAGEYEVIWDGSNNNREKISSGTYFYQIQAGHFVQAKKMILLK